MAESCRHVHRPLQERCHAKVLQSVMSLYLILTLHNHVALCRDLSSTQNLREAHLGACTLPHTDDAVLIWVEHLAHLRNHISCDRAA